MRRLRNDPGADDTSHTPTYAGRLFSEAIPKFRIPQQSMPADAAYRLIRDELDLDGNPKLNLASFVTSWMEPQADQLVLDTINKNMIDQDEYPQVETIHERVVTMLGHLLHVPSDCTPIGSAASGSSEAIMLAMLAHRETWRNRRRAAGLSTDSPNLVMGADVHTCWEKFARYFDVEARIAPMSEGAYTLTADQVLTRVDENTIAVAGLVGTTFTGQIDDLVAIDAALRDLRERNGWDVPMHIDAASGGFVVPFTEPHLAWDFRLESVRSINVSNHKFGLVYPGLGSVIFRDRRDLPEELVFHIDYLGGDMPNYSLTFSRPSFQVVLQYYNFLRLGHAGYARIMSTMMDNARHLETELVRSGRFQSVAQTLPLPVVVLRLADPNGPSVFELSARLRERGWIVPAYTLPADAQHIAVIRMVVKENMSRDMVDMLVTDIDATLDALCGKGGSSSGAAAPSKHPRPIC